MMKGFLIMLISLLLLTGCSEDLIDVNGTGVIRGKVVEEITFLPLENVKISTNPNTSSVFTDVNGDFEIEVESGQYAVQAEKDEYITAFESATIEVDGEVELVYELRTQTANNRAPNAPVLNAPADNATDLSFNLTLEWTGTDIDDDVLTYKVTLRNASDNTVQTFEDITDATLDITVDYGTTYFWQVTANDGINEDVNSELFTFSTANFPVNRFLFVKKVNGNNVIYSGDEDSVEVAITSVNSNSWRPRVSRVANKIAFLRSVGALVQVFVMDPDGNNIRQVSTQVPVAGFNLEEIDISWSSDGAKIYYPSQDKLYSVNLDGTGTTMVYQSTGNLVTEVDVNGSLIAIKTNDLSGYNCEILLINTTGALVDTVLTGLNGAVGGLDLSADNSRILYTRDITGFENSAYRQLNTQAFIYNLNTMVELGVSFNKDPGTNDLDARFSPTESKIIVYNQDNDGITQGTLQVLEVDTIDTREDIFTNGLMPDWE
ncbi:MAG: hypothetical protein ABJM08_00745 [Nonlabens sp.]|uniref:hypothetical protein n=2 Tax=Nonlabens sp. TaxID=1888209 RepID=UPI0032976689